jgi:hypothetical protein
MAATTANMGLKQWDVSTDLFSYTELKDNFGKIDVHDHTTGKGVQVPTGGIANGAVTLAKLATASVDSTKIVDASVDDADLVSPTNPVWRPAARFAAPLAAGTSGTVYAGRSGDWTGVLSDALGVFTWSPSGMTVAGKTVNWRTKIHVLTNGTAPAITVTVGAYPITATAGGAGVLVLTPGAAIATSAVAAPPANTITGVNGSPVSAPSSGNIYVLGLSLSGAMPANALALVATTLEYSHR